MHDISFLIVSALRAVLCTWGGYEMMAGFYRAAPRPICGFGGACTNTPGTEYTIIGLCSLGGVSLAYDTIVGHARNMYWHKLAWKLLALYVYYVYRTEMCVYGQVLGLATAQSIFMWITLDELSFCVPHLCAYLLAICRNKKEP